MTQLNVVLAPTGVRGFDADAPLDSVRARAFHAAGYRFAIRYVRRVPRHTYDISVKEIAAIAGAGLALGIVQHVAPENWAPFGALGRAYGATAAIECQAVGLPQGINVWCDLEGVKPGVLSENVIDFLNQWWDQVAAAGYLPGLYVGWRPGITAQQLYSNTKFQYFWAAYNLNGDQYPATRGVCMQQGVEQTLAGIKFDPDTVMADRLGNLPSFLAPEGWPEL